MTHFIATGWTTVDLALLLTMLPLLGMSAFFSCSETAIFRLGQASIVELTNRKSSPASATLFLVKHRRTVLITILIGNMTANVLYFVVSSVLMLNMPSGFAAEVGIAVGTLLAIIVFGEVIPKMAATARPIALALLLSPPLLLVHRIISPLRTLTDVLVITPLSRLFSQSEPEPLKADELAALVEHSSSEGIIDQSEQHVLYEVVELSRIRVREVMTPRVHMISLPASANEDDIKDIVAKTRLILAICKNQSNRKMALGLLMRTQMFVSGLLQLACFLKGVLLQQWAVSSQQRWVASLKSATQLNLVT